VNGKQLEEQYRDHLSGFYDWEQFDHADEWILFEENLGPHLSLDETALSQGELYTILTNKAAKGKKGALVAMIKGTDSKTVRAVLEKIPLRKRKKVEEVTLDMAASMENIARFSPFGHRPFPCAETCLRCLAGNEDCLPMGSD
jgi:transposase